MQTKQYELAALIFLLCIYELASFTPHCPRIPRQTALSLTSDTLDLISFERSCQVDTTIQRLRSQIPLLLVNGLDKASAKEVYAENFVLLGPNNEELVSDREELISLSSTLLTASAATRQASKFARSFAATDETMDDDHFLVSSSIILDANTLDKLQVKWQTNLLGASKVSGLSELTLDEEGLVSTHKLVSVEIDGNQVNAVGETLATLRQAVRSVQDSPLLSPLASTFPLLNEIREELIQQAATTADTRTVVAPELYATTAGLNNTTANMTLIDNMEFPLPGSSQWRGYASSQKEIASFVSKGIPILSAGSPKEELYDLFASTCNLYGIDGTEICSGGETVAEFYQTLATIRQGTLGNWKVLDVKAEWKTRSVVVSYVAKNPMRVEGKDRYTLSKDNLIEKIEQLEIVVRDAKVENPDFFRNFYQAVKTGRSTVGAETVLDLLQQVNPAKQPSTVTPAGPPQLSESAAASVYGILCALHQDLASVSTLTTPPASDFIAPNIALKGYLNEVLSRTEGSYRAAVGVALLSLRGALRSERVVMDGPPQTKIMFQADGRLRVDLVLKLRLKALSLEQERGIPLKVELISEYRVNKEGKIVEHVIVETRVNDQLTPGDVVTRFIKGTTEEPLPVQSVLDALNWARKITGSNKK